MGLLRSAGWGTAVNSPSQHFLFFTYKWVGSSFHVMWELEFMSSQDAGSIKHFCGCTLLIFALFSETLDLKDNALLVQK